MRILPKSSQIKSQRRLSTNEEFLVSAREKYKLEEINLSIAPDKSIVFYVPNKAMVSLRDITLERVKEVLGIKD